MTIEAVLFDLDGTLVDTAPDLVGVLNRLLREEGRPCMPYAVARNEVSNGALGLIRLGFGEQPAEPDLQRLRDRFLTLYQQSICVNSFIFLGLSDTLTALSKLDLRWGIVTNKPQAFTAPLLQRLGLDRAAACVVSGDSLPQRKPHPAPLQLAARQLGVAAERCIYVGDAPRDIEAGHAAGMATVAAAYGYIRPHEDPNAWGADAVIRRPRDIEPVLERWLRAPPLLRAARAH
jgi:N-acetyl-D-muramate 6-phosphate phosphatase